VNLGVGGGGAGSSSFEQEIIKENIEIRRKTYKKQKSFFILTKVRKSIGPIKKCNSI